MRLIKIKIHPQNNFWNLGGIYLDQNQKESPLIDVEKLTASQKKAIEYSKKKMEIKLFNDEDYELESIESFILNEKCVAVEVEDREEFTEDEELKELLKVQSITVTEEDIEDNNSYPDEITEDILEEAQILLKKNGNTVKKTILELDINDNDIYSLIKACYNIELESESPRKSIISSIEKKLGELNGK
jgi:hypothetical protein